ncbi:hypothetical protein KAR04_02875 [Candidatus Calescamantes bacterium]|nr:hypothetical protein [Candidatus Calescamantes bacterium]
MKNSKITKKEIRRILALAKITVQPEELTKLTEDLGDIIVEIDKIKNLSQDFLVGNVIFQQVNNQFSLTSKKMTYSLERIKENFPVTEGGDPVVPPIKGDK